VSNSSFTWAFIGHVDRQNIHSIRPTSRPLRLVGLANKPCRKYFYFFNSTGGAIGCRGLICRVWNTARFDKRHFGILGKLKMGQTEIYPTQPVEVFVLRDYWIY
jgi:hypothetical protein